MFMFSPAPPNSAVYIDIAFSAISISNITLSRVFFFFFFFAGEETTMHHVPSNINISRALHPTAISIVIRPPLYFICFMR